MFEQEAGKLWIGHEGGEMSLYSQGRFEPVPVKARWRPRGIMAIAADEQGDIWLLKEDCIMARLRDGAILNPEPGNYGDWGQMAASPQGTIWVLKDGRVSQLENGQLRPLVFDRSKDGSARVAGIGASLDGGIWVAAQGRLSKLKAGQWTDERSLGPFAGMHCTPREVLPGVVAVISMDNGFGLFYPDGRVEIFDRARGFDSDWVTAMCADHEGNIWAGTAGAGLVRIRRRNIETVSPPDAWQGRSVLAVLSDRSGAVWVGTEGAGLYRLQGGVWTNYAQVSGLSNPFVWSLAEDKQGTLWVGTWGGGIYMKVGDRFHRAGGMEDIYTAVPALSADDSGGLWGGAREGVFFLKDGKATWYRDNDAPAEGDIRCVMKGPGGALWAGTAGKGLWRIRNGELQKFTKTNGLSGDFIQCLYFDDEQALWIGTFGDGLCRFKDERFSTIGRNQGLSDNVICDIQDDGLGFFWMSSFSGIIRVTKAELNDCADGKTALIHCLDFGTSDGMPTLECSGGLQPAGYRTADGRIWFSTSRGLMRLDPRNIVTNPLPPQVLVEGLLVDDKIVVSGPIGSAPVRIAPGGQRFEFHYTALSYAAPERVRFRYRLEGLDSKWIRADTRRTADYSYIPPGNYAFRVIACNNDNVWNETGARLDFTVLPHFWQTLWFQGLSLAAVVAAVSGGVWFGTRRRMRLALETLERQRAVERERARIARDIHDDLGASLTRINLLSQSACRTVHGSAQTASDLNRISETARQTMKTMDEIVWAVDPKHDTLDSLASYLSRLAQDLMAASGIRCRLDFPLNLPAWPLVSEVRHNLFLAFKEVLHNIAKHSGASQVRIALEIQDKAFSLTLEDNGCGFDMDAVAAGTAGPEGNGLGNIRQRLADIGGQCEITAAPGSGTKVKLLVRVQDTAE
jgi:signal transduction histidine kinase/ligand-binding sensor domain-containing protein